MRRILLVEDDVALGGQLVDRLRKAGYMVEWLRTGSEALVFDPRRYDLVILDLMLPGSYGLDVLKRFREVAEAPVIVLSARNETSTKVRALELGADDYVTKPFWPEELLARLEARLRRPSLEPSDVLERGSIRLDLRARRVLVSEGEVDLTRIEFELLAALARKSGSAVSRRWLVEHILDPDREGTERTLDVHVSRLRRKLGDAGSRILTVWGVGYRLDD